MRKKDVKSPVKEAEHPEGRRLTPVLYWPVYQLGNCSEKDLLETDYNFFPV